VEVSVAPELGARGDEKLLRIALEDLIGNTWKFTAKQSWVIIEIKMIDELEGTVYFVHDNGAGFNRAHTDKLFGALQRLREVGEFPPGPRPRYLSGHNAVHHQPLWRTDLGGERSGQRRDPLFCSAGVEKD